MHWSCTRRVRVITLTALTDITLATQMDGRSKSQESAVLAPNTPQGMYWTEYDPLGAVPTVFTPIVRTIHTKNRKSAVILSSLPRGGLGASGERSFSTRHTAGNMLDEMWTIRRVDNSIHTYPGHIFTPRTTLGSENISVATVVYYTCRENVSVLNQPPQDPLRDSGESCEASEGTQYYLP